MSLKQNVDVIAESLPFSEKAEGRELTKVPICFSGSPKSVQLSPENEKESPRTLVGGNLQYVQ